MTEPKPTPEDTRPNPDENTSPPEVRATGFFNRVRRELKPESIHPSEAEEIVIMEDGDDEREGDR